MHSLDAITVGTWVVHRESCWGAQGTEENRCPEVAPGNPEWGDWWKCMFSDTLACLPYVRRAWPRTRGHIQTKAVGTASQQSGPGVRRGGCWEGHGKHLLWCFSRLQNQVGGKGCSLASPGLSAATPTFGKNSWLNQPNYSHSRNSTLSSTVLFSNYCLMLACPQEVWIPPIKHFNVSKPSFLWHLATLHLVLWDIMFPDRNPRNSLEQSHTNSDFIKPFYGLHKSPFMKKLAGIQWSSKMAMWLCLNIYFGVGNLNFLGLMTSVWRTSHSNRLPWGLNPGFPFVYLKGFKNTPAWAGSVRNQTLEAGALVQVFLQVSEVTQGEARTGKHREAWTRDLEALRNLKHETLRASRLHWVTCLLYASLDIPLKHDKSFLYQGI